MTDKILSQGIDFYSKKDYAKSLAFFLALPSDSGADKNERRTHLIKTTESEFDRTENTAIPVWKRYTLTVTEAAGY